MSLTYRFVDPATVVQAPGGVVAEFYSIFEGDDWRDNGKWANTSGSGSGDPDNIFSIFTTSLDPDVPGGRGWRSQQFSTWFGEMYQTLTNTAGPSVPNVGQVTTWRHFTKIVSSDPDGNYHSVGFGERIDGLNSNGAGGMIWTWSGGGPITPRVQAIAGCDGFAFDPDDGATIPRGEWARFEYNWARLTTNTWDFNVRVYTNVGSGGVNPGTLIADETTLEDNFASGGQYIPDFDITFANAAQRTIMEIGVPGLGSVQAEGYEMERHAAFAAITDDVAHTNMPYGYFSHEV